MSYFYPKRFLGTWLFSLFSDKRKHCYYRSQEYLAFLVALLFFDIITIETFRKHEVLMEYLKENRDVFPFALKRKYKLTFEFDEFLIISMRYLSQDSNIKRKKLRFNGKKTCTLINYLNDYKISYNLDSNFSLELIEYILSERCLFHNGIDYYWEESVEEKRFFYCVELDEVTENWKKEDGKKAF